VKALITGANGQLGRELQRLLPDAIATDTAELDITDATAVRAFDWSDIKVIYNAAAYTNVDGAEQHAKLAEKVNAAGPANLAEIARAHDITLVQPSTDYVFDGTATQPYPETAERHPQGVYGTTKARGEEAVETVPKRYLVRTSWVYGEGHNFVRTMLKLGADRDEITVVSDQLGRPTYAKDLATALVQLVQNNAAFGTYHFQNDGAIISWAAFATAIFEAAGISCRVVPITTAEYTKGKIGIAPRPAYAALALEKVKAVGINPRPWLEALAEYIKQELQQ